MAGCCRPGDLDDVFDAKTAESKARDYERKGLSGDSRRIVDLIRGRVAPGYTLLEIGGGIGEIQLELLKDGAASAVNVELATTYETAASELIGKHGMAGRIERRVADFVAEADRVAPADVVVLNRVVCCYPDAETLVGAAAERTRRLLVITFPVERWPIRLGLRVANLLLAVRGSTFRGYAHPTSVVVGSAERRGLRRADQRGGFIWQLIALER